MRWRLLVPFIAPELRFVEEVAETIIGHAFSIRPSSFPLGEILVQDLPSVDAAREVFWTLRRGIFVACINLPCGIRVEDELVVLDDVAPLPSREEQPFICPQDRSLARIKLKPGPIEFQMSFATPRLMQDIQLGATFPSVKEALSDHRVALACTLYVDSFF